ncbi:AAA family ATPase [Flammeovirga pectinis]|uniref:AAA family ATPase n=1 Tax=Flammeovirga pectinis TaxID=2494373 RepID=A0A3Q9FP19_9BACT|nr:AAA family ATPase [Flammeovirga pectinis]AZQ61537.1 AAA family ATPase [Flammeovirga pectinis]
MRKFPIGLSDFKEVIQGDYYYVDKSLFIEEIIDSSSKSMLIPRPRRFGKTINMSMLKAFFDSNETNEELFEGLKIKKSETWQHQGRCPVIFLTFKDIKEDSFLEAIKKIADLIKEYIKTCDLTYIKSRIDVDDQNYIDQFFTGEISKGEISFFLKHFSTILEKVYNQKVVILIDEYDSCIIKAWTEGYHKEMVDFMRNFLSGGYKDNTSLYKGIITGILRVAKESIFSGLNNLDIFTVLEFSVADKFGLTESEVQQLLEDANIQTSFADVKKWYNGYTIGLQTGMYNPWSILNFADKPAQGLKPYWVNTSANELIEELLTNASADLEKKLTRFIDGQVMTCEIEETTIFKDLDVGHEKTVLGLLLFNGYLTAVSRNQQDNGFFEYGLKIPNKEVNMVYKQMLERLLNKANNVNSSEILSSLLEQDADGFEYYLSQYLMNAFSYNDFNMKSFPERVYHAFVLGLMAHLSNQFIVKSNPETGLGRAGLLIYPKGNNDMRGWVLEFKAKKPFHKNSLEEIAQEAINQIHTSQYITTLKELGKTKIMLVGVAFDGKEVSCAIERNVF